MNTSVILQALLLALTPAAVLSVITLGAIFEERYLKRKGY